MNTSTQPKRPPSLTFIIGVIVIVFALTSILFIALSSWAKSKYTPPTVVMPDPLPISSWSKYTNDQYNFSLSLPNTFSVESVPGVNGKDQVGFRFIDPTQKGWINGDGTYLSSVTVFISPTLFKTTRELYEAKKEQMTQDPSASGTVVELINIQNNLSAVGIYNSYSNCPFGLWAVNKGYLYELVDIYACRASITSNPTLTTIADSFKFTK